VVWSQGWCSKDQRTLEDNWPGLIFRFFIDDQEVSRTLFTQSTDYSTNIEIPGIGKQIARCRVLFVGLYNWPLGHFKLVSKTIFDRYVYDGWESFASNSYSQNEFSINVSGLKPTPTKYLQLIPNPTRDKSDVSIPGEPP
jgi:hypothetical protein